jgi:hypothetical protein
MNTTSIHNTATFTSQRLTTEMLAAVHENAKQCAQALRREAVSGLIDDMIAWAFRRAGATRRAANARSEVACHS